MINYIIKKAVAASRYDLIVNGITIDCKRTKKEIQEVAASMVSSQLLMHDASQKKALGYV